MASSIAHEISQPLNVIRMAAQNALAEAKPETTDAAAPNSAQMSDGEFRRFGITKLQRIVAQVDRAATFISRMRMFSRRSGDEPQVFDICDAGRNAVAAMANLLHRDGIAVRECFPDERVLAIGSQALTEQVISYLLRNAREALAGLEGADRLITISATGGIGDRVQIRVSDNGPGVQITHRDRIFEPFFTTKPTEKHTGLGLSMSYGIIHDLGGLLTLLESDEGATFQIDLRGAKTV